MRYFFCIVPPLAVLLCGKPVQAFLNLFLTLCFYVPGVVHSVIVVHEYYADKRTDRVVKAIVASARK